MQTSLSAFHHAAENGHAAIVNLFLQAGTDVDVKDKVRCKV